MRGNTSAKEAKKPFKIKLQKKYDLLFRGCDSVYKDKEWVLLHDEYLINSTGFKLSSIIGMTWVPSYQYVNVIMNDRYRGIYMLTESVKRNPDCRLNVDKNSGFIFENDVYWWNESIYVYSPTMHPHYNYTFKYPDDEDITEEQLAYMQDLVNRYEASLDDGTYTDMIDATTFAAWCLVHDIMGTVDGGGCNRYFLKYDTTEASKITMPLAWDFDMSNRNSTAWSRCHLVYMKKLFASTNRTFTNEFVRLWYGVRKTVVEQMRQHLIDLLNSDVGHAMMLSYQLDNVAWDRDIWFANQVTSRQQWFTKRFNWLDPNIMDLRLPNDVNVDGTVNITDVTYLISMVLNDASLDDLVADVNGDGVVNITDVTELISVVLNQE